MYILEVLAFSSARSKFFSKYLSFDNSASFQEAEAILEEIRPSPVQALGCGVVRLRLPFVVLHQVLVNHQIMIEKYLFLAFQMSSASFANKNINVVNRVLLQHHTHC
jgi:hypothetical protein